jgi:hypothetical protein
MSLLWIRMLLHQKWSERKCPDADALIPLLTCDNKSVCACVCLCAASLLLSWETFKCIWIPAEVSPPPPPVIPLWCSSQRQERWWAWIASQTWLHHHHDDDHCPGEWTHLKRVSGERVFQVLLILVLVLLSGFSSTFCTPYSYEQIDLCIGSGHLLEMLVVVILFRSRVHGTASGRWSSVWWCWLPARITPFRITFLYVGQTVQRVTSRQFQLIIRV